MTPCLVQRQNEMDSKQQAAAWNLRGRASMTEEPGNKDKSNMLMVKLEQVKPAKSMSSQ